MMNPTIFDMRAIAAQDLPADAGAPGFLDKLMASLRSLPAPSDAQLASEMLERAEAYADSQPSFAADLRAAASADAIA